MNIVPTKEFSERTVAFFWNVDKEQFLYMFPEDDNAEFKWNTFSRIRRDWLIRYGEYEKPQIVAGKKISFYSKVKWAFRFIDERWPSSKKPSRLISWFGRFLRAKRMDRK